MKESNFKDKLNIQQQRFCELYVSDEFFAQGTHAYGEAYGLDISKQDKYFTAANCATKLLKNAEILGYINELLELGGLNDEFVDKQLLFVITQNAEMGSKVSAIREYNKLKDRIEKKLSVQHKVEEVKITIKRNNDENNED